MHSQINIDPLRDPNVKRLAQFIADYATVPGDYQTLLPELSLHRRDAPTDPIEYLHPLGLFLTIQGHKRVLSGDKVLEYFPGQALIATSNLPVVSYVSQASVNEPFIGLLLKLDARIIEQIASDMNIVPLGLMLEPKPLSIETFEPGLMDALCRLIYLLENSMLLPRLAPLVQQEIITRLLTGPQGLQLHHLLKNASTKNHRINKVIRWIKQNFTQNIRVDDLAVKANMSPATFREHFRTIAGMSPLQFQKQLRLHEARQLMLYQNMGTSLAASTVGYESVSQFIREYRRLFGASPQQHAQNWRQG